MKCRSSERERERGSGECRQSDRERERGDGMLSKTEREMMRENCGARQREKLENERRCS